MPLAQPSTRPACASDSRPHSALRPVLMPPQKISIHRTTDARYTEAEVVDATPEACVRASILVWIWGLS